MRYIWFVFIGILLCSWYAVPQISTTVPPISIPFVSLIQSAGSDVICALHTDTITGMACGNPVTDGTTETAFVGGVAIPAGTLSLNQSSVISSFIIHGPGAGNVSLTLSLRFGGIGGTQIFKSPSVSLTTSLTDAGTSLNCTIIALTVASPTTPIVASCAGGVVAPNGPAVTRNILLSNSTQSIAADTTTAKTLVWTAQFSANTTGNAIGLYSMFNGIR